MTTSIDDIFYRRLCDIAGAEGDSRFNVETKLPSGKAISPKDVTDVVM